jgi:microsomal dipeptidase-like Zn-dependent dipeptidase
MKQGMGWFFNGDFNDQLHSQSWEDRFSSQANPQSLEDSQLDLVVATLYAHPLFKLSLRDSIRTQIRMAKDFVLRHPNWTLATTPEQAIQALQSGKRILLLALEGASGILETEEDFVEFIDEGGIRIVTLLHLTDDSIGGVAFLKGLQSLSSPISLIKSIFSPHFDERGTRINARGLSEHGKQVAKALMEKKVWIDLAHSSDLSQKDLFPLLHHYGQPHLYTHTVLRKYFSAERAISHDQLKEVARTQGFIGIIPSEQMLAGTPSSDTCKGSVGALLTQFQEASEIIGLESIGIGSDFNGGLPHLRPSCQTGTSLDQSGFWNIGQSKELWRILYSHLAKPHHEMSHQPALHFLRAWSRLWQRKSTS